MTELEQVKLYKDYVLILPTEQKNEKSKGGLYIPETAKQRENEKNLWGKVVKVGAEVKSTKVGDSIFLGGFRVDIVPLDNEDYFLVAEEHLKISIVKK